MKKDRTITQICKQCSEPYSPTRKGVQKFCSASCRSRYWFLKQQDVPKPKKDLLDKVIETKEPKPQEIKEDKPISVEKMSLPGVGNAAAGFAIIEGVIGIAKAYQPEHKKPATKGDLKILLNRLSQRFLPVQNVSDQYGNKAFYDKEMFKIVFYNEQMRRFELPLMDL